MTLQVLLSCMNQKDDSIISRTNIQTDVLVINQTDNNNRKLYNFQNANGKKCTATVIYTTERGLSKSRNLAIDNANGDICLICDDDEILEHDYESSILEAFRNYDDDIIAFKFGNPARQYSNKTFKVGFFKTGKIGSVQLAFRLDSILHNNIRFNIKMGSGTGNGAGEENRFLIDCIRKGLKIRYVPVLIGHLIPDSKSSWFTGFNNKYWINRGWQSKMIYGKFWGYIYLWYGLKHASKDKENSTLSILRWLHQGFISHR